MTIAALEFRVFTALSRDLNFVGLGASRGYIDAIVGPIVCALDGNLGTISKFAMIAVFCRVFGIVIKEPDSSSLGVNYTVTLNRQY